jgi:hypothetical protein
MCPFLAIPGGAKKTIITFNESSEIRTDKDAEELMGYIQPGHQVILDLSKPLNLAADWIRWFARMQVQAKAVKGSLVLHGVNLSVKSTIAELGLTNHLIFSSATPLNTAEQYVNQAYLVPVDNLQQILTDWYQGKDSAGLDPNKNLAFPVFGHKDGVVRYHMVAPREQGPYILFDEGPGREPVKWKYGPFITMFKRVKTKTMNPKAVAPVKSIQPPSILLTSVPADQTLDIRRQMHENQPACYALIAAAQLTKAVDPFDPFDL